MFINIYQIVRLMGNYDLVDYSTKDVLDFINLKIRFLKGIKERDIKILKKRDYKIKQDFLIENKLKRYVFRINPFILLRGDIGGLITKLNKTRIFPKIYYYDESKSFFPFPVLLEEYIPHKKVHKVDNKLLSDLAYVLARFHSYPYLTKNLKNFANIIRLKEFPETKDKSILCMIRRYKNKEKKYISLINKKIRKEDLTLVHSDIVLSNMIYDMNNKLRLIDLEGLNISSRYDDIAYVIIHLGLDKEQEDFFIYKYNCFVDENINYGDLDSRKWVVLYRLKVRRIRYLIDKSKRKE